MLSEGHREISRISNHQRSSNPMRKTKHARVGKLINSKTKLYPSIGSTAQCQMKFMKTYFSKRLEKAEMTHGMQRFGESLRIKEFDLEV